MRQTAERDTSDRETDRISPPSLTRLYLEVLRARLPFYARHPIPRVERLWNEAERCLAEFDEACRNKGVPWALVIIPDELQIDPEVQREALARLRVRRDDLDLDGPNQRLVRWSRAREIPVLDLLPLFREEHHRLGRLYFPNDTHWNEKGNRVAGEAVARFVDGLPGWSLLPGDALPAFRPQSR